MDSGLSINHHDAVISSEKSIVYAAMPVGKDATTYNMKHQNRGQALIFINVDSKLEETAAIDVKNFEMMCTAFGILVRKPYKFKERMDINRIFDAFAKEDHKGEDCVLVFFITCEERLASIESKHSPYRYEGYILPQLFPDECPTLAGLTTFYHFGVQSHTMISVTQDGGATAPPSDVILRSDTIVPPLYNKVYCKNTARPTEAKDIGEPKYENQDGNVNTSYKIPVPTDFLIVYNTSPAVPVPAPGSVFYECFSEFCMSLKEMKTDSEDYDLLSLLTGTIDAISRDAPQESIPMWTSTLIREVCFFPSEKSE
ncbi:caspase-1 isoform X1 [Anabrus simplex]|uniref:caspase-1 isoform X1 n=1 Tax=Anabrus simplex TaxID=316456 RepID=UPI0035A38BE3